MFYQWDFAFLLRYTPKDAEEFAPVFLSKLIETVEYLLLRFVADAAGVIQQQIGF